VSPHDPEPPHRPPRRRRRPARHDPHPGFPVDPDVTETDVPRVPGQAFHLVRARRDILLVIAAGGALGAAGRYGVAVALPHDADAFPWSTLATNVAGCFALGVLMVLVVERLSSSRLVRPFFGTGLLGGFTTFSTYAVDTRALLAAGRPAVAAAYLVGTLVLGLLAVAAALRVTERVLR
jgi:fluoride exporter